MPTKKFLKPEIHPKKFLEPDIPPKKFLRPKMFTKISSSRKLAQIIIIIIIYLFLGLVPIKNVTKSPNQYSKKITAQKSQS